MKTPHIHEFAGGKKHVVYICAPLKGDIAENIKKARGYCRGAFESGYIPYAAHLAFESVLDEHTPTERETALEAGAEMVKRCDALWVFGNTVTEGMKREIETASEAGIPIEFRKGATE